MKLRIYEVRRDFNPANHLAATLELPDTEEIVTIDIEREDLRVFVVTRDG